MGEREPVARGVDFLDYLAIDELSLAAVLDRLEVVTTDPTMQRRILDRAAERDVIDIDREEGIVTPRDPTRHPEDPDIITKDGTFSCNRCGRSLSTGYFINLETGDIGPYGSSCIRRVTGRD